MRIGIIGSGRIGGTLARLLTAAEHEIALSHGSDPVALREQIAELGPKARAASSDEVADFGEVVILAIPWQNRQQLPADRLKGKIVVDAMNPYRPDGGLYDLERSTSTEEVAMVLPGSRLVKAFNTLHARDLAVRGQPDRPIEERTALPIAGDDQAAKRVIAVLVEQIGFAPVDSGSLREGGRLQQPGGALYARVVSGAEAEADLHPRGVGIGAQHA